MVDMRRQDAEEAIQQAAVTCLARSGSTTIKEIANEAGLAKANIHYYYKTKAELVEAIIKQARGNPTDKEHAKILARYHLDRDQLLDAMEAISLCIS
jgi:AcrR family transcriptional regulator